MTAPTPPARLVAGRPLPDPEVLAGIRMVLLDVDGVLTDGRIWFDRDGYETKAFHVHDAAGLAWWRRTGGLSGLLSGRGGEGVARRAKELKIDEVVLGRLDKEAAFRELLGRRQLAAEQVAYVGDDLLDLPVLRAAGLAATVPQARPEVAAAAHFVTPHDAGFGAARDVVELLLRARGAWDEIVRKGGRP